MQAIKEHFIEQAKLDRASYEKVSFRVSQSEVTLQEFTGWVRDTVFYLEGCRDGLPRKERRKEQVEAYVELCTAHRYLEQIPGASQHRMFETIRFGLTLLAESAANFTSTGFKKRAYSVEYMRALGDVVSQAGRC